MPCMWERMIRHLKSYIGIYIVVLCTIGAILGEWLLLLAIIPTLWKVPPFEYEDKLMKRSLNKWKKWIDEE